MEQIKYFESKNVLLNNCFIKFLALNPPQKMDRIYSINREALQHNFYESRYFKLHIYEFSLWKKLYRNFSQSIRILNCVFSEICINESLNIKTSILWHQCFESSVFEQHLSRKIMCNINKGINILKIIISIGYYRYLKKL